MNLAARKRAVSSLYFTAVVWAAAYALFMLLTMSGLNFILSFSVTAAIMATGTLLIYFHLQGYLVNSNALQMLAIDFGTVKSAPVQQIISAEAAGLYWNQKRLLWLHVTIAELIIFCSLAYKKVC